MDRAHRLWPDIVRLLERVVTAGDRDGFLDECLDTLVEQFGAQRGLVFQAAPHGAMTVLAARGPRRQLAAAEREEISRSVIRRARDEDRVVVWSPTMGMSESMLALTITTAIAAPLSGVAWREPGERERESLGVLYLDFRDVTRVVDAVDLEFFKAAAALVAVVLELSQRLQVAREDLRAARARADDAVAMPSLDELLWPASMAAVRREVESAIAGRASMLILGESGTGKTALARAIAETSGRRPIVRGLLGASDDLNTITSELFGHERGAFSGAMARRVGLVELARGGTLILDEILNLPRHAQQLLLDFTQFGTFRPLGFEGVEPRRVAVRLIAATNGDMDAAIRAGSFRGDLYYRLAAVTLRLPPLRARSAEIPELAEGYLRRADPEREWTLSLPLRTLLASPRLPWPGNVRQLEAVVQRASERARARDPDATQLAPEHFEPGDFGGAAAPAEPDAPPAEAPDAGDDLGASFAAVARERDKLDAREREVIAAAMAKYGGVLARAARELQIPRTSLVSRIQTLRVEIDPLGRTRRG